MAEEDRPDKGTNRRGKRVKRVNAVRWDRPLGLYRGPAASTAMRVDVVGPGGFRRDLPAMEHDMGNMNVNNSKLAGLVRARQARRARSASSVVTTENGAPDRLSRLDPARRAAVEDRLSQMPKLYRGAYLRAMGGRSRRSAIRAFCLECTGWQRAEVARCMALACPLFSYRPFQEERSERRNAT